MRRGCRIAVAVVAALVLNGCAGSAPDPIAGQSGRTYTTDVITVMVSGSPLTCAVVDINRGGGMSCDWQGWHADRMPK